MHNPEVQPQEGGQNKTTLNELNALLQETYMMGANDSEIPHITKIIEQFKAGEITAEEAFSQALSIKNGKQDYH